MCDLFIVRTCQLVNGQKLFISISIKTEMSIVVICKVVGINTVAYNKQLHKAKQRIGIAVSRVAFVVHNLLHGSAWAYFQTFQFNLNNGNAVNQQNHIIAMIAVFSIYPKLIDNFIIILTPVFDVH